MKSYSNPQINIMEFEEIDNTLYCRFGSEMSTMCCTDLAPVLNDRIVQSQNRLPGLQVEFDLAKTHYICSTFLRLCLLHCKQVGIANFRITHTTDTVRNVFEIAGLIGIISIS